MKGSPEKKGSVNEKARQYYNSTDADTFYFKVWGGEDIHIGLYRDDAEAIFDASRRTVASMAGQIDLAEGRRVLDIGAGYGGSARYLARNYKVKVGALNLSEVENERNREMNREQGLEDLIEVTDGDFEHLPYEANAFDVVWSQDAILHSGNRRRVFEEVGRVLKPGGTFIFTDPMQREDADRQALQPVYDRIHLNSLGSVESYDQFASELGFVKLGFEDHSQQLPRHYQRVHDILSERFEELRGSISVDYMERMKSGLQHWIRAGNEGLLRWGILRYRSQTIGTQHAPRTNITGS
jgi:sarcosine/dimethylglycine N-methyltransferase